MEISKHCKLVLAFLLCLLGIAAPGDEPVKHQLSSVEECNRKYARSSVTETKNGIEVFEGNRDDLNPKYPRIDRIHVFDKKSLQVWPLVSEQIAKHFAAPEGFGVGFKGQALDPSGSKVAASPAFYHRSAVYSNIVLIDINTRDAEVLVADGQLNYALSFSPDGRHIAYYSTDRRTNPRLDPSIPLEENAGRVVNVQTKEVTTFTDHFVEVKATRLEDTGSWHFYPPQWLDDNRVLFSTLATDRAFISKYVEGSGEYGCPYVAVAYLSTGEVKRLFMPDGHLHIRSLVDQSGKRLILSNVRRIIQTDFDLNNPTVLVEVDASKRMVKVRVEDGEVKYKIVDR